MSISKTKVTRILDSHNIAYRVLPHSEPVFTVEAAAKQRGVAEQEMVKCILLRDKDGHYVMACVQGHARLDTKALRMHLPKEWKRLRFASAEEILTITSYVQGAVAPVGLPDDVPVVFDEGIAILKRVSISSGDPMAGLELEPKHLMRVAGARLAPIAETV